MRGEYTGWRGDTLDSKELPPRARRILIGSPGHALIEGTTSACAENTRISELRCFSVTNYLRVRGEYTSTTTSKMSLMELPPRARRIPGHGCCIAHNQGTTSACAENTIEDDAGVAHAGNYLRVRGEYGVPGHMMDMDEELPPRARRIRGAHAIRVSQPGTTSACAENTRRKQRKLP